MTHFIEYHYFYPQGDPLGQNQVLKTNFMLNLFLLFSEDKAFCQKILLITLAKSIYSILWIWL